MKTLIKISVAVILVFSMAFFAGCSKDKNKDKDKETEKDSSIQMDGDLNEIFGDDFDTGAGEIKDGSNGYWENDTVDVGVLDALESGNTTTTSVNSSTESTTSKDNNSTQPSSTSSKSESSGKNESSNEESSKTSTNSSTNEIQTDNDSTKYTPGWG